MNHVGIDVSKDRLSVHILEQDVDLDVANNAAGIRRLVSRLRAEACRVALEATASYHRPVTRALAEEGIDVMVANPRAVKAYANAVQARAKTDAIDAKVIAQFARSVPFRAWVPPGPHEFRLRGLVRRRGQLVAQRSEEKTRLEEARHDSHADPDLCEDIQATIDFLNTRVQRMEAKALELIRQTPELARWHALLVTIPGVADVTAMLLIAELCCMPSDLTPRQITAYAGLDPRPHQSGRMDASRRISRAGNKRLRTALYLAAWNTTRFSEQVGAWRQRLVDAGKAPKVADVAVARKLIHSITAMRRDETPWDGARWGGGPKAVASTQSI